MPIFCYTHSIVQVCLTVSKSMNLYKITKEAINISDVSLCWNKLGRFACFISYDGSSANLTAFLSNKTKIFRVSACIQDDAWVRWEMCTKIPASCHSLIEIETLNLCSLNWVYHNLYRIAKITFLFSQSVHTIWIS